MSKQDKEEIKGDKVEEDEGEVDEGGRREKLKFENKKFGATNTFIITHEDFPNELILIEAPPKCFRGMHRTLIRRPKIHLFLTHGHSDHVTDAHMFQRYGAQIYIHERDFKDWLSLDKGEVKKLEKDKNLILLKDGDELSILGQKIKVIHTPGHTRGGVCFHFERVKKLFVGDTIFKGEVGRSDLEFGSWDHLKESIARKIYVLDKDIDVYPGHGSVTKIGDEKGKNKYI